jgi:hypothetical protein
MKSGFGFARVRTIALALAMVAMSVGGTAARAMADSERGVKLNAGETYMIEGIDADSTPEVRFGDNPNAFSVQSRSASELLVLAVHAGKGMVRVKLGGKSETYAITVAAIADRNNPLAPPKAPAATLSDSTLSSGRERTAEAGSSAASALDPGAGPAKADDGRPCGFGASGRYCGNRKWRWSDRV